MGSVSVLGQLTVAVLCAPLFAVYFGVSLELALSIAALLAIGVSVGISIPDIAAQIALAADVTAGLDIALEVGVPSVNASLSVSISAQLILIEGFIVALEAVLAIDGASIDAYTYVGAGGELGSVLGAAIASPGSTLALIFAATSAGSVPAGQVASCKVLGGGQSYERGLCSVTFPPSPAGSTATGTLTIGTAPNPTPPPSTLDGVVTGVTITSPGSGYLTPPLPTIADSTPVLGATNASPIVVTIADTTDLAGVTLTGVRGNTAANGMFCGKVLSAGTFALYKDPAFTEPVAGNGTYIGGGKVTGSGSGAAVTAILGGGAKAQLQGFFDGLTFAQDGLTEAAAITLGDLLPATFGLLASLLGNLQAQASAIASGKANFGVVPPTVDGDITVVASIDAKLKDNLDVPPPSIQASLSAALSGQAAIATQLMAEIGAQIGFSTEKLQVLAYSGPANDLGPALTTKLAAGWPDSTPASSPVDVVVLSATSPAAQAALGVLFPVAA
jgi:hypothetical protein